jgi:hypothetical protein
LPLLEPKPHAVNAKSGRGPNSATVTPARVIAVSVRNPSPRARFGVIEPQVYFRKINAGLAKLNLHGIGLLVQKQFAQTIHELANRGFGCKSSIHHNAESKSAAGLCSKVTA